MLAFLVVSLISGFTFAVIGVLGFGAGLLAVALWYVAGCWAGFTVAIAAFLVSGAGQSPTIPRLVDHSAIR